jgi:hypothetical protein
MLKFSQLIFTASRPILSGYNKWTAYKTLRIKKGWSRTNPDYNKFLNYEKTNTKTQDKDQSKEKSWHYDKYNDRED